MGAWLSNTMTSSSRYTRNTPVSPNRRVVVTGLGAVTPLGLSMDESWAGMVAGKSGIGNITRFDSFNSKLGVHFAGELKGFSPDPFIIKKEQKKMDQFIHYTMASAHMALQQAGLTITPEIGARTGCLVGVGMGGLPAIEEQSARLRERGQVSPFFIPMTITNLAAGQVSIKYGLKGPNYSVTSACASGAHSIGESLNYIRHGHFDVMLAGGAESAVCAMAMSGFESMQALSSRNEAPEKASRPFDKDRDGFVLAEGAAILVLESLEHAEKRGAPILAEVLGYGVSSDAYHMTAPAPGGEGASNSILMAIKDSGLRPENIGYINAHGTSTPLGDQIESQAVERVFGAHAKKLWVSSTKSMTGHTLGAAGAIESAVCVMALQKQIAPPTINLENPGEGCNLDYVPNEARAGKFKAVLNNSFGFGGTNASLVFGQI
jgi:3-oxoacyl-[acyl-carrier-protein] synthase II